MTAATPSPELGDAFLYRGRHVVVIQRWLDPFGLPMLRIRTVDDQPEAEDGMREASFLADANPSDRPASIPD